MTIKTVSISRHNRYINPHPHRKKNWNNNLTHPQFYYLYLSFTLQSRHPCIILRSKTLLCVQQHHNIENLQFAHRKPGLSISLEPSHLLINAVHVLLQCFPLLHIQADSCNSESKLRDQVWTVQADSCHLEKKKLISSSLHLALNLWMFCPYLPLRSSSPSRQLCSFADTWVFRISSFRTKSSGQRFFSYQAPTTWNKLPASIRHASSVSSFKSSLKTFLFSKTFSSVPLPWGACVCQGMCLCVRVCASVGAYVCCLCIWIFDVQIYVCVRFVSA